MKKSSTKTETPFTIPNEALSFLAGLERNNNKRWFDAHKAEYQENVLTPLKMLVTALGFALSGKLPGLKHDPRVNGSIFRINRDTRFSRDKRPYKTHAAVFLWVGPAEKLACPGVYFHLDASELMLGAGVYMFARESLDTYRRNVAAKGGALAKAIAKAETAGFELGGEKLKRVPSGFPPDHKHAELLKMKGLHVGKTYPAKKATEGDLIGWLVKEYAPTLELVKALEKMLF